MGDKELIERVDDPGTVPSLVKDFRDLGITAGDTLLVHSSLRAVGWVSGGPQAVIDALQNVLTDSGTLIMPTHTPQYTDPAGWSRPPVPDDWEETIRETMPPFRPEVTPTWRMGVIPECFRNYPSVVRSEHPTVSFAAWGAGADEIVTDHGFDFGLGEHSPLARVYERNGDVLLLGVGHDSNTSLHLAEYRADFEKETVTNTAPVLEDGERVRAQFEDIETNAEDFTELGTEFEQEVGLAEETVGAATARRLDQRELVDFAVEWFEANR